MNSIIPLGQKNTLAEYLLLSGADNRPSMLEKDLYDSWKSIIELYMQNREHGRMILESAKHGSLIWPTVEENGVTRTKKYVELSAAEKIQADCDIKPTNIILQGTSLTKHERECKLYDAFDKFAHIKEESLPQYYLRFTRLINDMNIFNMKLEQFQVNTKFLNSLPPEWSKFVADVKLVKDFHTTNFDQLHTYLEQHELHTNEVRLLRECNQDPLVFMVKADDTTSLQHLSVFIQQSTASTTVFTISIWINSSHSTILINLYITTSIQSFICSIIISISVLNGSLNLIRDDPIACLNTAMAFLTAVASSRFPSMNNQLRTSSNPRNQDIIQDGRVTVQQVQGRQGQSYSGTGYKSNANSCRGNNSSGQARVVKCYNCQDPRVLDGQAIQTIIPNNVVFQTEDLDTYDSNCDDISNAKAVLVANISNHGSDVISEVPHSKIYLNDKENHSVLVMQDFEQPPAVDFIDNEIHSDSNIIPYS
uniref:Integrase, catalytic region, zinc finger, CCHC-type, peptidase aspartic, catalytic n=1 Tax=Tanacetum cinerariifolium TaxID=118510 RepID=A0A6L2K6B3_TANCI|nr:hypothetical protein [Tanacetum cinerariifolium]